MAATLTAIRRCVLLLLVAGGAICAADGPATRPPNIVYILADDLGYGEIGSYGQKRFRTPHIDQLAREGTRFTSHYAGAPICAPSRNALMTGQHTGHTTIRGNFGVSENSTNVRIALRSDDRTVAQVLQRAGYHTALIGKWGLGEEGSGSEPWNKGFDFFYGFVNQTHAHNQFPEFLYRNAAKEALVPNFSHKERVFANDRFTEEALQFIARQRDQPFFLYLAYTTPHADLKCPADSIAEAVRLNPELANISERNQAFAGMVVRLDRDVGRLMACLEELGLDRHTVVFFTSDNGPHREDGKDIGYFEAAGPLRGIKGSIYEGGIRVPFIARWPGQIPAGRTSDFPSAFWDFYPTACGLARTEIPEGLDGISILPELLGHPADQRPHEYLYWELLNKGMGQQAIRDRNWKAVRLNADRPIELYELHSDPGESHDIASQHADLVRKFARWFDSARTASAWFPIAPPSGGEQRKP